MEKAKERKKAEVAAGETAMAEAMKKAEVKAAAELAKADPFAAFKALDLEALAAKEESPEKIAERQAAVEAKETEQAEFAAKVAESEVEIAPKLNMLVERRENFRGVVGGEKNFATYDGAVADLLRQVSGNSDVAAMVQSVYILAAAKRIADPAMFFGDLTRRGLVKASEERPSGFSVKFDRKYYGLTFRVPQHLYLKVCEAISTRVGEVFRLRREERAEEEARLRKWAGSDNAVAMASGKPGKYFIEIPPQVEVNDVAIRDSRGKPVIDKKTGKPRTRKETTAKSGGGAIALEVTKKRDLVFHAGLGVGQKYVAEAKGVTLSVSDLAEPEKGRFFYRGKGDWKVAQVLRRLLIAAAEYQAENGRSSEAEKELAEARKTEGLVPFADLFAAKAKPGSALVVYADLVADPSARWEQSRVGGRYFRVNRDRERVYFDRLWNVWAVLTLAEAGDLVWSKVASHIAPFFKGTIGKRLESADPRDLPRGIAMRFFKVAKRATEAATAASSKATKNKSQLRK